MSKGADKFIRLRVMHGGVSGIDRIFNLRYVKSIQPSSCSIMMHGSGGVFVISRESMARLLRCVGERESVWTRFKRLTNRILCRK